jgi:BASS family bile acid:Na+ symporter
MSNPVTAIVPWALSTVMLALALDLPAGAWRDWPRHRFLLLRVELASCVLIPLLGFALLKLPLAQQLSSDTRHALALMAVCPSAPLIMRKAGRHGGDPALASLLQVGAAMVAIVSVPLLADLGKHVFALEGWEIKPRHVAMQVGQMQLLPLLLGLGIRGWRPGLAERLQVPLNRLANALLLLLLVAVLVKTLPALISFALGNGLAVLFMGILILASLGLGFALGGNTPEQQTTSALVTSMRNPGLALLLASSHASDQPLVKLAILLYVLICVAVSTPLLRWSSEEA